MGDVLRPLGDVDVVDLVREVALDVIHDLLPLLGIHFATLGHQHLGQLGVGHAALIGGLLREIASEEEVVDFGEGR